MSASRFGKALVESAAFVEGCSTMFTDWVDRMRDDHPNELRTQPDSGQTSWGDPNQIFYHGYWRLDPGEALLIEFTPPDCFYWNFQLDNRWMESLDYRWLPVTVNKHSARYEPDGSVRIIVAARDPGFGNWMDPADHTHGAMGLRWNQATEDVTPVCRLTTLADFGGGGDNT